MVYVLKRIFRYLVICDDHNIFETVIIFIFGLPGYRNYPGSENKIFSPLPTSFVCLKSIPPHCLNLISPHYSSSLDNIPDY